MVPSGATCVANWLPRAKKRAAALASRNPENWWPAAAACVHVLPSGCCTMIAVAPVTGSRSKRCNTSSVSGSSAVDEPSK
jgi:hypothetical protein